MTLQFWALAFLAFAGSGVVPAEETSRLDALVAAVRSADYRGDRVELQRLAEALDGVKDLRLKAYRSYWRGFARWRRALNGFNETPMPPDFKEDVEGAIRNFRAALAEQPAGSRPR